jgi:hypothetical protein
MDPLLGYARRDSNTYPFLRYDRSFIYEQDAFPVVLDVDTYRENAKSYVDPDLHAYYKSLVEQINIPDSEAALRERANPLVALPKVLEEAGTDIAILTKIFGLQGQTIMVRPGVRVGEDVLSYFLRNDPPQNIILGVPDVVDAFLADLVYLLTKLFAQSTLLQLTCSDRRYLICINYQGNPLITKEMLSIIPERIRTESDIVTKLFQRLPDTFETWLTFMNNTHLSVRSEFAIHLIEVKIAFDSQTQYWTGVSYDFQRVVKFLLGEDVEPKLFIPKDFQVRATIDEPFVTDMHLYGESEDHTDRAEWPLHEVINFETDKWEPYRSTRSLFKSGIAWGQRKLLMAEIDFLTAKSESKEPVVAIYVGAAPFSHGLVLLDWFPSMKFVLVDPRKDEWDKRLDEYTKGNADRPRIVIKSVEFNNDLARQVGLWFSGNGDNSDLDAEDPVLSPNVIADIIKMRKFVGGVKKVFFISDIRRGSYESYGFVANEFMIHEDMTWQKEWALTIYNKLTTLNEDRKITFWCSFKFRLPFVMEIGGPVYRYGKGDLHTQPWSRLTSAELRLWWDPSEGEDGYDKKKLEDIMMFHNHNLRAASYGPPGVPGYCKCHDCHYEIDIIRRFMSKFRPTVNPAQIVKFRDDIDGSMTQRGQTLKAHADWDRDPNKVKKLKAPVKFFKHLKGNETMRILRYRPMRENVLAKNLLRLKGEFRKFLGSEEASRNLLITLLLLHGKIRGEDVTLDLVASLSKKGENQTDIDVAPFSKAITNYIQQQSDDLSKVPEEETSAAIAHPIKGHTDFYDLTSGEEPTMEFHKNILPRFLERSEKLLVLSSKDLRSLTDKFLPRPYCVLKHYGAIWDDHFATCPNGMFEEYPELLEGTILGLTILSTYHSEKLGYNEKFMALNQELELGYTVYLNVLTEERKVLDSRTLFVFLPKIRILQQKAIEQLLTLLNTYEGQERNIVFLLPESFLDLIPLVHRNETLPYLGNFYDSLKAAEKVVDSKDPYMIVRSSTKSATYRLAH